jgi:hypothetical protein
MVVLTAAVAAVWIMATEVTVTLEHLELFGDPADHSHLLILEMFDH